MGSVLDVEPMLKLPFINSGYRINYHCPKKIVKSLFTCHNELVNTWTHLIGALLALILGIYLVFSFNKSSLPK